MTIWNKKWLIEMSHFLTYFSALFDFFEQEVVNLMTFL